MHNKFAQVCKKFCSDFLEGDFFGLAAEMSFYLLSCFLPMIIFVFTIASSISQSFTDTVLSVLGVLPDKIAKLLVKMLVSRTRSSIVIITTGAFSIFSVSGFILTLKKGLDRFYGVKNNTHFIINQIKAIFFAFFIFISIIASVGLIIFGKLIAETIFAIPKISYLLPVWNISRYVVILIFIVFVVSALFKALPSKKLKIYEVIPGAAITTLAWYVTSMLFALYVNNFPQYEIIYGSLAGFACLIMWIYITGMVMVGGAKINSMIYNKNIKRKEETSKDIHPD